MINKGRLGLSSMGGFKAPLGPVRRPVAPSYPLGGGVKRPLGPQKSGPKRPGGIKTLKGMMGRIF